MAKLHQPWIPAVSLLQPGCGNTKELWRKGKGSHKGSCQKGQKVKYFKVVDSLYVLQPCHCRPHLFDCQCFC